MLFVKVLMSILYSRATQLILTKVQLGKFNISRGPDEFLICNDKNETMITSKYRKILGFSYSLHQGCSTNSNDGPVGEV